MQNEVRFFYTPVGRSEYIVDEKVCRDSEARNHAAILYRKWIERLYQNADAQEYSKISDEIFQLFKRFSRSNDDYVHLGFLAVIDQLVDLGYQEEDRNVRISQYLETMIQETHSTMLLIPLSSVTPLCSFDSLRHSVICFGLVIPIYQSLLIPSKRCLSES